MNTFKTGDLVIVTRWNFNHACEEEIGGAFVGLAFEPNKEPRIVLDVPNVGDRFIGLDLTSDVRAATAEQIDAIEPPKPQEQPEAGDVALPVQIQRNVTVKAQKKSRKERRREQEMAAAAARKPKPEPKTKDEAMSNLTDAIKAGKFTKGI